MSSQHSPMQRVQALTAHLTAAASASASSSNSSTPSAAAASAPEEVWIVGLARTPIGSAPLGGALAGFTAPQLGGIAIKEAVRRAGIKPAEVEECIFGCVLSAGVGQAPARQAALAGGLPIATPCTTVNKVCASGMKALQLGTDAIRAGSRSCVVVGGMESMSNVPFYLTDTRNGKGLKMGDTVARDGMIFDGLTDAYSHVHMGTAAELCAQKYGLSRAAQDAYAKQSYERAQAATKAGRFASEIVPVDIKGKDGKVVKRISEDQEVYRAQFDRFGSLKPSFPTTVKGVSPAGVPPPAGTVTAANSSVIGDGAAALVLMAASRAKALGLKGLAVVLGHADAALNPLDYPVAPEAACRAAVQRAGLSSVDSIDVWELNEAFSAVALANMQLLNIPASKINLNGGAVSLGHPIGCSGARILCTLISVLQQQNKTLGCASLCNGGGGASAVVLRRIE